MNTPGGISNPQPSVPKTEGAETQSEDMLDVSDGDCKRARQSARTRARRGSPDPADTLDRRSPFSPPQGRSKRRPVLHASRTLFAGMPCALVDSDSVGPTMVESGSLLPWIFDAPAVALAGVRSGTFRIG